MPSCPFILSSLHPLGLCHTLLPPPSHTCCFCSTWPLYATASAAVLWGRGGFGREKRVVEEGSDEGRASEVDPLPLFLSELCHCLFHQSPCLFTTAPQCLPAGAPLLASRPFFPRTPAAASAQGKGGGNWGGRALQEGMAAVMPEAVVGRGAEICGGVRMNRMSFFFLLILYLM